MNNEKPCKECIVDYCILYKTDRIGLRDSVKGALTLGWVPYKRPFITQPYNKQKRPLWNQAMVKLEYEDNA